MNRLAARINDLSIAGAFIDSLTCYPAGTSLRLRFHIKDQLIETTAEVRYSMPTMGMGVQFLALRPDQLTALESLIEGKPLILPRATPEPFEKSESALERWNTADMLLGDFAIVSLFDVIQIIENNRLSGGLGVMSSAAIGQVQFNDGQIVGAHSGSRKGTEALKNFLDVTEGSFEFKRSHTRYPPTIHASNNMSLMLGLLRAKDEETAALA